MRRNFAEEREQEPANAWAGDGRGMALGPRLTGVTLFPASRMAVMAVYRRDILPSTPHGGQMVVLRAVGRGKPQSRQNSPEAVVVGVGHAPKNVLHRLHPARVGDSRRLGDGHHLAVGAGSAMTGVAVPVHV